MIELHRLGAGPAPFPLNPDLIVTVEATPDTTIALTTGTKVLVVESVEAVVAGGRGRGGGLLCGGGPAAGAPPFGPARSSGPTRPHRPCRCEVRPTRADHPSERL